MSAILLHFLPHYLAACGYGLLGFHFWRTRWAPRDKPMVTQPMTQLERGGIALLLVIHGIGLYDGLFGAGGMRFSFSFALSLMMWLAVFIYYLESFHSRLEGLQPMVLPLAALCALLPPLFPIAKTLPHAASLGFKLHFLAAMLAYSLFTLSALHAVFMGFAERQLHRRTLTKGLTSLPPLLTMEKLLFRLILIGFLLLTGALASGVFYSEALFGKAFTFDHKTLFAFASWAIFAALLAGRRAYGWRGKIAMRWTLAGFMVLLLAYMGSRFVAEVVLGR